MSIPIFGSEQDLPQTLGLVQYAGLERFEDADLGVKLRYVGNDYVKADVYLYDLGRSDIPTDISGDAVQELFREACAEVLLAAEQGLYCDLELHASQYLHIPDTAPEPMYLWAVFAYRQAAGPGTAYEGPRYSHLALRTDRGYINKVRYTYPAATVQLAEPGLIPLLTDWHAAVQSA
jgi:hypothetical protein